MSERKPYTKIPSLGTPIAPEWQCTACNKIVAIEALRNGLDSGLELSGFAGYYGGFTDQFDQMSQSNYDQYDKAYFCHSCCVKLLKTFPTLAKNVGIEKYYGHHPCSSVEPCCDYAWSSGPDFAEQQTIYTAGRDEDHQLCWKEQSYD